MDFNKKEMPIQGYTGFGGGATGAAFRSSESKLYVDDVFNTYAYYGTGSNQSIDNGMDLAGKGGMVWVKNRASNYNNWIFANAIGIGNAMRSNTNAAEWGFGSAGMVSYNSDGYTVGTHQGVNESGEKMVAWAFRHSKAFTTKVYYGTGSNQNISHDLGSVPGMIMIKATNSTENWRVYHRSITADKHLILNLTNQANSSSTQFNDTEPTASVFSVGTDDAVNQDGKEFIAYIFAGGPSTAATARSVSFDGVSDALTLENTNSLAMGTGDFTIEFWVYMNTKQYTIFLDMRPNPAATQGVYPLIYLHGGSTLTYFTDSSARISGHADEMHAKQWYHIAVSRVSGTTRMFLNGKQQGQGGHTGFEYSDSNNYLNGDTTIGCRSDGTTGDLDGYMSNVRVIKGTGLYASAFKPPLEPLTNVTNTALLCCNDSSVTGSTVTPGTITAVNNVAASTKSPFDDPDAFTFGEDEDQPIISCGSYVGNGSDWGNEVYLGWEPQWVLIKKSSDAETWDIYDTMRGIKLGSNDRDLRPDSSALEYSYNRLNTTPTGFRPTTDNNMTNGNGGTYVYCAVRMSDGYVGKTPEAGSEVYATDVGNNSATIPAFDSGFPVDWAFRRNPSSSSEWYAQYRMIDADDGLRLDSGADEEAGFGSGLKFDSNQGWATSIQSTYKSWMFKRGHGFDISHYRGSGSGQYVGHSLGRTPEMIWLKNRVGDGSDQNWQVYHKGLNGGTTPEKYYLQLNSNGAETTATNRWNWGAPTSAYFSVGGGDVAGNGSWDYIAHLFASVDNISKVDKYEGNGSASGPTVTLGFQPRLIIIKAIEVTGNWIFIDVTGTGTGNNNGGYIDSDAAFYGNAYVNVSSTGFSITDNGGEVNQSGKDYLYYAHA